MTLSEIKDPDGGLAILITERSACVSCLQEVGAGRRWGIISQHSCLGGLEVSVPWSRKEGRGGVPLKERRPTGWDKKVKEGWFGPQGKDRKALPLGADSVFVQLKAAPLG